MTTSLVSVTIIDDNIYEPDESFYLFLSEAKGASHTAPFVIGGFGSCEVPIYYNGILQ